MALEKQSARQLELHARAVRAFQHAAEDALGARQLARLLRLHAFGECALQRVLVGAGSQRTEHEQQEEQSDH